MTEREQWRMMVAELHQDYSLQYIAQSIGVSVRQVSNYKAGTDRPIGNVAVRLYTFHAKHRTPVPIDGTPVHSEEEK